MCIIYELAEKGELFRYVSSCGALNEDIARYYFRQLLGALRYMHASNYSHRNLKLENLVLDRDYNLKITDFGHSTLLSKYKDGYLRTPCSGA